MYFHIPHILLYIPIYEHPVYKDGVAVPSMHDGSPFLKGELISFLLLKEGIISLKEAPCP